MFNQESPDHDGISASPFRHATAKSYPSNPGAPHFSTPRAEVHFSLTNLNPGLPPPSFDNRVNPSSLERLPPGNPLPIPLLAETTPKSLRFGEPIAVEHPECGKSSDITVASHVAKRVNTNPNQTTKLPVLGHQADRASMLRSKQPSSNPFIVQQCKCILEKLGDQSGLAAALKASKHPDIHLHRVLDEFAPSTVLKYMSGILHFLKPCSEFHLVWYQVLFLGSCLVAIWGGLRFADAQRMPLSSIVLDRDNIRGSCFRTKGNLLDAKHQDFCPTDLSIGLSSGCK